MFIALVIVPVLLAAMAAGSAVKKLQKDEQVRTIIGGIVGVLPGRPIGEGADATIGRNGPRRGARRDGPRAPAISTS